ncbi:MAG: hypothetical protein IJ424_07230 [Oscillospiraceae bacterium]|nr:hypothetical protein [Oscillospiraceae bacterium]
MPIFSILGTISAIILGWVAFSRTSKTDFESEGKNNGVILTELGYVKSGIDDIKRKQERQEDARLNDVSRISAVESSSKQAHKRIDSLEERVNSLHQNHHEQA